MAHQIPHRHEGDILRASHWNEVVDAVNAIKAGDMVACAHCETLNNTVDTKGSCVKCGAPLGRSVKPGESVTIKAEPHSLTQELSFYFDHDLGGVVEVCLPYEVPSGTVLRVQLSPDWNSQRALITMRFNKYGG